MNLRSRASTASDTSREIDTLSSTTELISEQHELLSNPACADSNQPERNRSNDFLSSGEQLHLSKKNCSDAAERADLIMVYDFCNKLSGVCKIRRFHEQEIENSLMNESYSFSSPLTQLLVDLIKGFTSVDGTNNNRMFRRNRTYRETNVCNVNESLWEFVENDWKYLGGNRSAISNILGPRKDRADFFRLPAFIQASMLGDMCNYRLICQDAESLIDSAFVKHLDSIGEELRCNPIFQLNEESYYYFGGMRVYRKKILSEKTITNLKRVFDQKFRSAEDYHEISNAVDLRNSEKNVESGGAYINPRSVSVTEHGSSDKNQFVFYHQHQKEYYKEIFSSGEAWEVICRDLIELNSISEYFRQCGRQSNARIVDVLMNDVLPSVRKRLQLMRISMKQRLETVGYDIYHHTNDISLLSNAPFRCSMRLLEKKFHRDEKNEQKKRDEIEVDMMGEYSNEKSVEAAASTAKLSREERFRNRQLRIEGNYSTELQRSRDNFDVKHRATPGTSTSLYQDSGRSHQGEQKPRSRIGNEFGSNSAHLRHTYTRSLNSTPFHSQFSRRNGSFRKEVEIANQSLCSSRGADCIRTTPLQSREMVLGYNERNISRKRPSASNQSSNFRYVAARNNGSSQLNFSGAHHVFNTGSQLQRRQIDNGVYFKNTSSTAPNEYYTSNDFDAEDWYNECLRNLVSHSKSDHDDPHNRDGDANSRDDEAHSRADMVDEFNSNQNCLSIPYDSLSGDLLRIGVPEGSSILLNAVGPLHDHDYPGATAEIILSQDWKFVVETVCENEIVRKEQYCLIPQDGPSPHLASTSNDVCPSVDSNNSNLVTKSEVDPPAESDIQFLSELPCELPVGMLKTTKTALGQADEEEIVDVL